MSPILLSELPNEGILWSPGCIFHIKNITSYFSFSSWNFSPIFTRDISTSEHVYFLPAFYIFEEVPNGKDLFEAELYTIHCIVANMGERIAGCSMFKRQQMMTGGKTPSLGLTR